MSQEQLAVTQCQVMSELIKKFYKERLPNGPSSRLLLQLRLGPSRKLRNDLGAGGLQVCIQGKDLVCR